MNLTANYQISGVFSTNCAKLAKKKRHHWRILITNFVCFWPKIKNSKMAIFGTMPI
jgi:hypothetical protein